MKTDPALISLLDTSYQKLTGLKMKPFGIVNPRDTFWSLYARQGFTVQDLEKVVLHLKRKIREGQRNPGSLRFSNLIERLDLFDEELAMANAAERNYRPPPSPKERVVECLRPTAAPETRVEHNARPISFWIEQMREAARSDLP